ncbi:hypothetical protein Tco_0830019 [Tanacetum coccineum]
METKDTLSSCSNSEEQQMQQIQDKAKKSCMVSFRKLHSHLKHLSHDNLKGTRIESGFKRAFATLFGQDVETFLGTMFLNMDQLEKQLDKEEFQEIGSRKPALQPRRNQSVVRQPTAFKSERPSLSKQRFASQVDVNNDLSKPVTTHYLPKERESVVAKPHHMIAPGSSRYSSNDMVHNHYLEEAKKKTQESSRNSKPSVMPSAIS